MARPRKVQQTEFWESLLMNEQSYQQYYIRLMELSISMFDWKNLPDTVDARFMELALFGKGYCVFFKDEVLGYLALTCTIGGRWDVYRIPIDRRAYATNGYQKELDDTNSVLIFNNMAHTNSQLDVEIFAKRLYNLDRSIDVNTNAQKTPIIIQCDENQRLTLKNLYKQYEGNEPVIFGASQLDPNTLKVLSTGAPYVADKLYQLKSNIWNEALTYLGISNSSLVKKERMVTDEVTMNLGGVIASRYSRLESRRQACEAINNMFGLNIECNYREDFQTYVDVAINTFDGNAEMNKQDAQPEEVGGDTDE